MKRKKAAVVFNDIQGYTALMQENEAHAIALRQRHKEVVDRLTKAYQGTIIQYYGDGTLSIFDSCLDAVQCAMSMQKEFHEAPHIPLRIGINSGEILLGPDGIYGDSVNIASRIERMSVPGSVLISERVFDEIRNHGEIQTRELGQFELKNVRQPVGIHAVVSEGVTVPDPGELAGKMGFKEKTILVLPFYNLSNDPDNESLCDEITEQVINALSQMEGLRVTSRTSSFTFKDKAVNLRQLHQELGIDNVLEGSVRKHGHKLRITAQLINAADDFQLWSETYHREEGDAFLVQDEIASMISNKLKASFQQNGFVVDTKEDEPYSGTEANHQFQMGRLCWKQMQAGYLDQAIHHFKKALESDSRYFPAWAGLAMAYAYKGYNQQMLPEDASRFSLECLEEMDKINTSHPRAHLAWANYHLFYSHDWASAVDRLKMATQQQEQDSFLYQPVLHQAAGVYQLITGQKAKAIEAFKRGLKHDPQHLMLLMELTRAYLYDRQFKKALDTVDLIIRNRPDFNPAYKMKGWILFSMGRQREGIEAFQLCQANATLPISGMPGLVYAYARTSQSKLAEATKEKMLSLYQDLPMYAPYYDLALAHLGAQEYPAMFEQLQLAFEAGMPSMLFLEVNPIWDEIRRFNAYMDLIRKINGPVQRPPL